MIDVPNLAGRARPGALGSTLAPVERVDISPATAVYGKSFRAARRASPRLGGTSINAIVARAK